MHEDFDSEFMEFLYQFLMENPDVAKDQVQEWNHLWNPLHDKVEMAEVQEGALNDGTSVTIQ